MLNDPVEVILGGGPAFTGAVVLEEDPPPLWLSAFAATGAPEKVTVPVSLALVSFPNPGSELIPGSEPVEPDDHQGLVMAAASRVPTMA